MDGVSEDFSGLPEYKSRAERREEMVERRFSRHRNSPYRGHRKKMLLVRGFVLALLLVAASLIVLFAPTPYLGTSHSALAKSVGSSSARDCHPAGGSWICAKSIDGTVTRYAVKVDWAGCWSGKPVGPAGRSHGKGEEISGCVSIADHLAAG